MKYKSVFDMHTHTFNSPDGNDFAILICEKAFLKGLTAIALTDHFEIPEINEGYYEPALKQGYYDMIKAKAVYEKEFDVIMGIELGGAIYDVDYAKNLLSTYKFDFVLNSLHGVTGTDYHLTDYTVQDYRPLLTEYFAVLLAQCKLDLFDSLAHLDYPARYVKLAGIPCDLTQFAEQIDEILKFLAENGKALEINTSGLFAHFRSTLPEYFIIKRFKELGGEFITTGSDAHTSDHIGRGLEDAMELMETAGFSYVTYYKNRKPIPVRIEKI